MTTTDALNAPVETATEPGETLKSERPTFLFLGVVAGITLILDVASKAWAEILLNRRGFEPLAIIEHHLSITLAYNRGGAWGIFQNASETIRKPFFVIVSLVAFWFIVSLYSKLQKGQKVLTWGLPLVLGGALGNLSDRIIRSQVVDFIDYRADWVMQMNSFIHKFAKSWIITDHWPTFNVADIAICIGVGLMALDMFTSKSRYQKATQPSSLVPTALSDSTPSDSTSEASEVSPTPSA